MSALWAVLVSVAGAGVGALVTHAVYARRLRALTASIEALASARPAERGPALAPAFRRVWDAADQVTSGLQREVETLGGRLDIFRAALEAAPIAIVLFTDAGRITVANRAACELFFDGESPEGEDFLSMLGRAPDALRRALSGEGDELFAIDDALGERHTYHLAKRHLVLGAERVVLVQVKNLTREIHRQEAEIWKRMIRLFSHELNNSLAPVKSLVHSAQLLVRGAPQEEKLGRIFETVRERTEHLGTFLEGYARVARLPLPRKTEVAWPGFVAGLLELWPSTRLLGSLPDEPGCFDAGQIEQVIINLLKNASEAGGPDDAITLAVESLGERGVRLTVADRGPGMSEEIMRNALLPFYSTKSGGSGLGLPLCREIVEAHGGVLRLSARADGGLEVTVRLPPASLAEAEQGKLTLTRS